MRELALCSLPAQVEIGGRHYRVKIPTTRVALDVYAGMDAYAAGEEAAWDVVEAACRAWLPARLFDHYFRSGSLPEVTALDLGRLLSVGIRDQKRHEADRKQVEEEALERSWFAVLSDFCDAHNTDPDRALSLPWPSFVGLAAQVSRRQARRALDVLTGYVAARTGDDLLDQVLRQAGMKPEGKPLRGTFTPPPGWEEEQREKVKRYRQRFFGIKPGEA